MIRWIVRVSMAVVSLLVLARAAAAQDPPPAAPQAVYAPGYGPNPGYVPVGEYGSDGYAYGQASAAPVYPTVPPPPQALSGYAAVPPCCDGGGYVPAPVPQPQPSYPPQGGYCCQSGGYPAPQPIPPQAYPPAYGYYVYNVCCEGPGHWSPPIYHQTRVRRRAAPARCRPGATMTPAAPNAAVIPSGAAAVLWRRLWRVSSAVALRRAARSPLSANLQPYPPGRRGPPRRRILLGRGRRGTRDHLFAAAAVVVAAATLPPGPARLRRPGPAPAPARGSASAAVAAAIVRRHTARRRHTAAAATRRGSRRSLEARSSP